MMTMIMIRRTYIAVLLCCSIFATTVVWGRPVVRNIVSSHGMYFNVTKEAMLAEKQLRKPRSLLLFFKSC